jgi:hypothetical protein
VPKRAETTSQRTADVPRSDDSDFHHCFVPYNFVSASLPRRSIKVKRSAIAPAGDFSLSKEINFAVAPHRSRSALQSAGENELFNLSPGSDFHSFSIFASPGILDGRSVGTNSCDPCIARVACSSASILMLNLI